GRSGEVLRERRDLTGGDRLGVGGLDQLLRRLEEHVVQALLVAGEVRGQGVERLVRRQLQIRGGFSATALARAPAATGSGACSDGRRPGEGEEVAASDLETHPGFLSWGRPVVGHLEGEGQVSP